MPIAADAAFLFLGGPHQVYHLAPVAAALAREYPDRRVACLCFDAATLARLEAVRDTMAAPALAVIRLPVPWLGRVAARLLRHRSAEKGPMLAALLPALRRTRALVVPERTSAALRRLGWRRPLIHFRHGAGDRALASDRKLAAFDLIVVAGEKDLERTSAFPWVDRARVAAAGYVKLDYLARTGAGRRHRLFPGTRPVVVYNPHFDPGVSSWPVAEAVMAALIADDRYDVILAPHARLAADLPAAERARWEALAVPGRVVVDFGSPRSFDMTYLRAADIYVGDVSSQLYEFIAEPRPAVFVNAHAVDWRRAPRYASWQLGEVAEHAADVVAAVERARENHPTVAAAQRAAVARSLGDPDGAIDRGAALVADALDWR